MRGLEGAETLPQSNSPTRRGWRSGPVPAILKCLMVAIVVCLGWLVLSISKHKVSSTSAARTDIKSTAKPSGPFHWQQCGTDPHYLCGYLTVPLDYTNQSDPRTANISTVLYQQRPGKKSEKTLVIEPGGPGGSGTTMLWNKGKRFGEMYTDGQLDVLGFDPRGVNLSSPSISCFPHDAYRDRWRWLVQSWPEVSGYDTLNRMDAINEATLRACEDKYGDIPRFLTTAFVARDVDAIREALGEDTLTAFMVSYGTGIGQTYAQMFPDRVGNVALDGMEFVRDGWTPWGWSVTSLDNVTDAFEDGLIGECVRAGPKGCALAMDELQSDDVYESAREALSSKVHTLIQSTKQRPISGVSSQGAGIVSYENLVEWLYHLLYQPPNWKSGVQALAELENGNATLVLEEFHKTLWTFDPSKKRSSPQSSELEMMVLCGDSADAEQKSLAWWKDLHVNMTAKSWISGSSRLSATLPCRHFKWQPAEIYRGGFNNTLRNPLLLIGGPYDPATPLRNGRRLAKEMGNNARMLVHHGYGHSSARDLSACSNAVIQAYILNGTVPQTAEVHCHADKKPFDADFLGVP